MIISRPSEQKSVDAQMAREFINRFLKHYFTSSISGCFTSSVTIIERWVAIKAFKIRMVKKPSVALELCLLSFISLHDRLRSFVPREEETAPRELIVYTRIIKIILRTIKIFVCLGRKGALARSVASRFL